MANKTLLLLLVIVSLRPARAQTWKSYVSDVLIINVGRATNLIIDAHNTVFFSYDSQTPGIIYYLARYNLVNQQFKHVDYIENGRATVLDYATNIKYFGAGQTIYRYNDDTNEAEYLTDVSSLYSLHMMGDIAFVDIFGDVHRINGKNIRTFGNLKSIRLLNVDRRGKIFYTNDTGLYDFDPEYNETRQYFVSKTFLMKAMAVDKYDDVYIGGGEGIFKLNQNNCTASKIGRFVNVYGLAFDRFNNIVYSNENQIIRAYVGIGY